MRVGPAVPEEIQKTRAKRYETAVYDAENVLNKKTKQFFDPTKSVSDELKQEILSGMKKVKERFE